MNIKTKFYLLVFALFSIGFFSCKKDNTINTPVLSEFATPTAIGKYFVKDDPNSVLKIPVGITTVSNKPRTVTFSVSSPTGAVEGQQYNLGTTSIVIPAGTAQDSISLKGIFAGYPTGRTDTLIFTITGGDVSTFKGFTTYTVVMQKYCEVNLNDFIGDYANSVDNQDPNSYGPYTATINSFVSTGPTSATIYVTNFAAAGFGPWDPSDAAANPGIAVKLDWTDPSNFTTIIPTQSLDNNLFGYGPGTVSGVGSGTFSSCKNTITLSYEVKVGPGSFGDFITVLQR
jgi:hypothetical protein